MTFSNSWQAWALLSAFFAGLTAVLAKVGVAGIDSNLATAIRTTVVGVFAWLLAWALCRPWRLEGLPGKTWLFLALSGLATGLSWICYFRALQLGQASRVAPIDKLSVVMVIALSAMFLGERLNLRESCGAGLIVVGALLLAWK
ncbi:MAG: EamA family transporter [Chthoniobacteraceae bacterium]|nr:EamA family transporter [Chthoniobacteraceae bacterium]